MMRGISPDSIDDVPRHPFHHVISNQTKIAGVKVSITSERSKRFGWIVQQANEAWEAGDSRFRIADHYGINVTAGLPRH